MKRKVDLHIHTNASDGTSSNLELINELKLNTISIFSITDHDSIENSINVSQIELPNNIKFIGGVEVSSFLNGLRYHILGYFIDFYNDEINDILLNNQNATNKWFSNIVKIACSRNPELSYNDYENYKNDRSRGGHEAINYLLDKRIIKKASEFSQFARESQTEPNYLHAKDVINSIHNANGITILAHPSEYKNGLKMSIDELKLWIDLGIDGIECFHQSAKIMDQKEYLAFCKDNELMITGGSDYHGLYLPERKLGFPEIFEDMINIKGLN